MFNISQKRFVSHSQNCVILQEFVVKILQGIFIQK